MISSLDKYYFKTNKYNYSDLQNIIDMSNIHVLDKKEKKPTNEGFKNIVIRKNVYNKLKDLGRAGDSFNDVLEKILAKEPGVYHINVTDKE